MLKVLFHDDSVSVYFGKYCENILSRVRKKTLKIDSFFIDIRQLACIVTNCRALNYNPYIFIVCIIAL